MTDEVRTVGILSRCRGSVTLELSGPGTAAVRRVTLNGVSMPRVISRTSALPARGAVRTEVPEDFWHAWVEQNPKSPLLKGPVPMLSVARDEPEEAAPEAAEVAPEYASPVEQAEAIEPVQEVLPPAVA